MDSSQSWFSLCTRGWGWTLRIQKSKYIFKLSTSSQATFVLVPSLSGWYPRRRPTPCPWGWGRTRSKNTSKWSAHQSKQLLFWSQVYQGDNHGGGLPHVHRVEVGRGHAEHFDGKMRSWSRKIQFISVIMGSLCYPQGRDAPQNDRGNVLY